MRKYAISLLCFVSGIIYGQQPSGINIEINAPGNVVAGNDFQVEVVFNKGKLSDYSRFSQELPAGVTATNISSPNADFTYDPEEKRIRIIWLKMPEDPTISVNYSISVDRRLKGALELGGAFAYVLDGERNYLSIGSTRTVNILPNPELDPSEVIALEDFEAMLTADGTSSESTTAAEPEYVVREAPVVQANGIVNITLRVRKPQGTRYLKLEEKIPGGYTFESINGGGAVVSQAAGVANFVWMQPPGANEITLKYRLVPILEKEQEELTLDGSLTYTEGEESKMVKVIGIDEPVVYEPAATVAREKVTERQATADADKPSVEQPAYRPASRAGKKGGVITIPALEEGSGVYFRVQIAAVRNPYYPETIFAGYDLLENVRFEKISGWHKYTVGSYKTYQEASQMKNRINSETPVRNAFVVAYRDGMRIDVATAMK